MEDRNPAPAIAGLAIVLLAVVFFSMVLASGGVSREVKLGLGIVGGGAVAIGIVVWVISAGVRSGIEKSPLAGSQAVRAQHLGDGPGYFSVAGVVSATGEDTRVYLNAGSPANAKVKAELAGIVVTEVTRIEEAPPSPRGLDVKPH